MPSPDEEEGLYWQDSSLNGSPSIDPSSNEGEGETDVYSQPDEEEGDALNNFLHDPLEEDEEHEPAVGFEPEWGSEQAPENISEYLAGDKGQEDEEDKGYTDDGRDFGGEKDQQQEEAAPEDVDAFMFEDDARPKEHVQFFFEMGYADQDVDDRLPSHIKQNRTARKQVRQLVKQHVQQELTGLDLEGRFFTQHTIPQYFEFEDRVYTFSYYLLPYELPVDPPPTTKTENFSAILEAEPEATKLAIANIFLLFCGFALSLVVISCDTAKCKDAGNIGQLLVGFAALLLACVEGYMQFLVASPSGS